ncbi:hypothetical protein SAMN04488137_2252 [Fictibacillus solisalsi]|uniref:Virginiamycin B lyase n=1 Tax=Fictibacillus solisalsi TaxID=459525 RepID=A0A1G9WMM4_9BACL|nr:hypothetical protein [Fictibacillus solisalsi]SDM85406.1 hypothetical protein SAMN04488137_2252 [Fictibacillus solisalsi]
MKNMQIEEFPVPCPDSGPYGMSSGKKGEIWFTQHKANFISRINKEGTNGLVENEFHKSLKIGIHSRVFFMAR